MNKILFDLDGTLTDPKVGITSCIRYALEKLEVSHTDPLDWCIGPPLYDSFRQLIPGCTDETVLKAVDLYRERFAVTGMYENVVYEGIEAMLEALVGKGYELYVATSKPRVFAKKIIEHFKLDPHFHVVYGSELDGSRTDKSELIHHILSEAGGHRSEFVMIGDRKFDLIGAHKNFVRGIGILWGYGSEEELRAQPSIAIHRTPADLTEFLVANFNS